MDKFEEIHKKITVVNNRCVLIDATLNKRVLLKSDYKELYELYKSFLSIIDYDNFEEEKKNKYFQKLWTNMFYDDSDIMDSEGDPRRGF